MFNDHPHSAWLVVPAVLGTGLAVGAVNSFVIVSLRVGGAFIVTLGMQYAVFSLSEVFSGGSQISGVPSYLTSLANRDVLGVPGPIVLVLVVAAALAMLLNRVHGVAGSSPSEAAKTPRKKLASPYAKFSSACSCSPACSLRSLDCL